MPLARICSGREPVLSEAEGASGAGRAFGFRTTRDARVRVLWRQARRSRFITDFICHDKKLIVEVDGGQHSERQQYDRQRTRDLESRGYDVIRFWNNDVLQNLEGVVCEILRWLEDHA